MENLKARVVSMPRRRSRCSHQAHLIVSFTPVNTGEVRGFAREVLMLEIERPKIECVSRRKGTANLLLGEAMVPPWAIP